MSESIRAFVAAPISLPAGLRTLLRRFREMGRAIRAVDSESVHLTLKYLGETPTELVPEVIGSLESIATDIRAFELELKGIGSFPHWQRPLVVWAGVEHPEPLIRLVGLLEAAFSQIGFARERRQYHPHLTLARIKAKPPAELFEIAETHETKSFGRQTIDRVILYQSDLQKTGPVYTPLATVLLEEPVLPTE